MAVGDAAAAAGIPVVPSTKDLRLGFGDINAVADALALREAALDLRLDALEAEGPWITYTPTLTNFALGAGGTRTAEYRTSGKQVTVRFRAKVGTGYSWSNPTISLPIAMASPVTPSIPFEYLGGGTLFTGGIFPLAVMRANLSLTAAALYAWGATGSGYANIDNSTPTVMVAGDGITATFTYRIA